jgi:hypothetical protein
MRSSDDRLTLCGLRASETFPHMLARFVTSHRAGHARVGKTLELCHGCEDAAVTEGVSMGEPREW